MRFGPAMGFVALILAAVVVAAISSQRHPGDMGTVPPNERPDPTATQQTKPAASNVPKMTFEQARVGAIKVAMNVEERGTITLELYPKAAPKTVEHFVDLCKKGFYDGILFHRVVPNFVVQAGDPGSKKTDQATLRKTPSEEVGDVLHLGGGGSGQPIPFEDNGLPNDVDTIAMALSQKHSATGDSQFFINLVPNHSLDGDYCVFGKVLSGVDVVSKIQQGDRIKSMKVE